MMDEDNPTTAGFTGDMETDSGAGPAGEGEAADKFSGIRLLGSVIHRPKLRGVV